MSITLEINNPYLKRGNWDAMGAKGFNEGFQAGADAACKAKNPRKFSEELPEEDQRILLLSNIDLEFGSGFGTSTYFHKISLEDDKTYEGGWENITIRFTHWMPFPELADE